MLFERPGSHLCHKSSGLTLLEIVAAVVIVSVLALMILPRLTSNSSSAKSRGCETNRRNVEVQARLWYRTKGSWPANNLSDIGASTTFFPSGVPTCPVDGSTYTLDASTHRVSGHSH